MRQAIAELKTILEAAKPPAAQVLPPGVARKTAQSIRSWSESAAGDVASDGGDSADDIFNDPEQMMDLVGSEVYDAIERLAKSHKVDKKAVAQELKTALMDFFQHLPPKFWKEYDKSFLR